MFAKFRTINTDDGLPNEQIHALDQDKFGRLWLASPAGLAYYNGNNVIVYDSRSGLECLGLRTITISNDNIIWIGTDRGLEAMDINGKKIHLNFKFDWYYGIAESIVVQQSTLWVGTSFGLLRLKLNGNDVELEMAEDFGLVSKIIVKDNNSILVVTTKFGLIEPDNANWRIFNTNIPSSDPINCLKKTLDNKFLVGTINGLYILNSDFEIINTYQNAGKNKKLTAIAIEGDYWWLAFGTNLQLVFLDIGGIVVLENIEVGSIVKDLFIDNYSNVWVATNNAGLKKISCLRNVIRPVDCGIYNSAFSIQPLSGRDKLMIGGVGYSSIIASGVLSKRTSPKVISTIDTIVWDTAKDPVEENSYWLATEDGLFKSVDEEPPMPFEEGNFIINSPNRILLNRNDEIWLGTISGLFKIQQGEVTEILNANGNKFGYVYNLTCTEDNVILVGTLGQGLWIETPVGFKAIITEHLTEKGNTYSVACNASGKIAVIQEEKIVLVDKQLKTTLILQEYPIAGWTSVWIDNNTLATGSNNGVIIVDVNKREITQRINLYLSKSDWQFTSSRSLYYDNKARLYCGLNHGLFLIDFHKLKKFNIPPKVYLENIIWNNVEPIQNAEVYKVASGFWSVTAHVYASWFIDEKQVCFRFRLLGFEEKWSVLNAEPYFRYNSLLPGNYELQCQAYTNLTGYGDVVTIMHLEVTSNKISKGIDYVIDKLQQVYENNITAKRKNKILSEANKMLENEIRFRQKAESDLKRYKEQLEEIIENRTKALSEQKNKAEHADKMKSLYLADISHEIRSPLNVVSVLTEFLQKTHLDNEQKEYVQKMLHTTNHLQQIINDLLDISKIESGNITLEKIPFNFNSIVDFLKDYANVIIGDKKINFLIENEVEKSLVMGDPFRLKQVLINLLSNAIKFTKHGNVTLKLKTLNVLPDRTAIKISITDTGIGIKESQLEKLFKPFQQADSSIARHYGGTGLGLNISYRIIELMGGKLKVKSVYNEGSTFYFTIPFALQIMDEGNPMKSLNVSETNENKEVEVDLEQVRKLKILIAEDDELVQFIFKKLMDIDQLNYVITSTGKECIDTFADNGDFDIIFMDLHMPEMDGIDAIKYIRNEMKNSIVKIVVLTANTLNEVGDELTESGINDFITKPISQKSLYQIFDKFHNNEL